jgi:hypothetical protein
VSRRRVLLPGHGVPARLDTPRLFYMHFWGVDDPLKLASGVKAALEQTNVTK